MDTSEVWTDLPSHRRTGESLLRPSVWDLARTATKGDAVLGVYVMGSDAGPVKVGASGRPEGRLREVGAEKLYLFMACEDPFRVEAEMHIALREVDQGGEWFNCRPEVAVALLRDMAGAF